jgi:hypothetical protein
MTTRRRSFISIASGFQDLVQVSMPNKFSKGEIEKLQGKRPSKELLEASEKAVLSWINQYVEELKQIEEHYKTKMSERIERFITLQAQYYSKYQLRHFDDMEQNQFMVCPITGDTIEVDNAGQIAKLTLT